MMFMVSCCINLIYQLFWHMINVQNQAEMNCCCFSQYFADLSPSTCIYIVVLSLHHFISSFPHANEWCFWIMYKKKFCKIANDLNILIEIKECITRWKTFSTYLRCFLCVFVRVPFRYCSTWCRCYVFYLIKSRVQNNWSQFFILGEIEVIVKNCIII
jgi:hypothetical protein